MAVALGKRKRAEAKTAATGSSKRPAKQEKPDDSDSEDMRDAFRRAFEAKFKPLHGTTKKEKAPEPEEEGSGDSDEDDDDWEGISEDDEEPENTVEVVEVAGPTRSERLSKAELKAFMSSKPPTQPSKTPTTASSSSSSKNKKGKGGADDDPDDPAADAMNLKNDLALQRLLQESHLLDASSSSSPLADPLAGPTGKNRHKATALRLQALCSGGGSKASSVLSQQQKMPMAHRKGIKAKAAAKEATRRREARENGIVLERVRKDPAAAAGDAAAAKKKRERGVGGPGVGRFSGGTLRLSKRDVASITGEGRGGFGGKKGGKRR
ncbi:uncharacterized protein BKCO1_4600063 [Diplodia corticola]|uniref:Swr1-complex protein 5 n=1 Tax=Diplodia corticola TaxID=236234 RepID=A0A1J9QUG5_9PEZI|nr:uncharacterized protein BKCO1_4600063 [Diplodia corticola]OJD31626.1 hypothetical protein BKCO1_4600063 [Diplodia corticola]